MADAPVTSLSVVLGRVFWMMVGPLALVLTIYSMLTSGAGWRTLADLLYFAILGGMILGRWLEYRGGNPQTSAGDPLTPAGLRRYILSIIILGPIVWVLANWVGNHLLTR